MPNKVVALDNALNGLAKLDERKSRIVEMKFFGGLTIEEIAKRAQNIKRNSKKGLEIFKSLASKRNHAKLG